MSFFDTLFGSPDLKALKEKGDIDGLIRALGYLKDSKIRLDAARMLGDFRDGKATKKLIRALEDSDPQVVRAAITSLGLIGDEQALDPLKSIVDKEIKKDEPESILLGLAFHSIKQLGGIEYLIDSYHSTNEYIRFLSLKELSDLKDPRLFQLFANELNGNSWLSSSPAVDGLANLGDTRAIPYLVPALRLQKEVRWKAAN
jgi:hypothetical protein